MPATKIALGTVQFGLEYGINNSSGQVNAGEVGQILNLAAETGIDTIDTAAAYGRSEAILGQYPLYPFRLVSKLAKDATNVAAALEESLQRLSLQRLYGYLIHDFASFQKNLSLWEQMQHLKASGKIEKIGFSLYHPGQLKALWKEGIDPDLVQIPYNLFDRRFEHLFETMHAKNVEIHTRSAFLQGLFFKHAHKLPAYFAPVKAQVRDLHQLSESSGIALGHLCLGFCLLQKRIDRVVIGVDNPEQFSMNMAVTVLLSQIEKLSAELQGFAIEDESIMNPANWPK